MKTYLPSLLVANIFDPLSRDEATIMSLYHDIAALGYYQGIETRLIMDPQIRREFVALLQQEKWDVTFWVTSNLNEKNYNLSDGNENKRREAVSYMQELIDLAVVSNGKYIGFGSGKWQHSPADSLDPFKKSLLELITYIKRYPQVRLLLEPLDMLADKCFTIGNLVTVKELIAQLIQTNSTAMEQLYVCLDSAHIALNQDDFQTTLEELSPYSNRVHFANAILDTAHPQYGDKHLPFGAPGFLTANKGQELMKQLASAPFRKKQIYLTAEVRSLNHEESWKTEKECREFIQKLMGITVTSEENTHEKS